MRSFSSLVHDALFPSTRVYHDENGNYRGTSTDITPWMLLLGRIWGDTPLALYNPDASSRSGVFCFRPLVL